MPGGRSREAVLVALAVFALAALVGGLQPTRFDNYTYLADALLHGRLWVDPDAPKILSIVLFNGHYFVIEPPTPGLLMLPFALFFHTNANQTLLSVVLLSIGSAACWCLVRRLGLDVRQSAFVSAVMLFATSYFYGGLRGDVWQLASVCADTFVFLLLHEVATRNRPGLVATYALAAGLSRTPFLPLVFFYGIVAFRAFGPRYARKYAAASGLGLGLYVLYNLGRWGTPFDLGYHLYETVDVHSTVAMLGVQYLPMQLHAMFFYPMLNYPHFPWIVPSQFGIGMVYTGAVFAASLFAPRTKAAYALWAATLVTLVPSLLYYDTGDEQYAFRHTLDFAPFLITLLALCVRRHPWPLIYGVGTINVLCGVTWMLSFYELYAH